MKQKIAAKFGGSSVKNAQRILESAKIVKAEKAFIVIVSAVEGTTDHLVELSQAAATGNKQKCDDLIEKISSKHYEIAKGLKATSQVLRAIKDLLQELRDASRGAYLLQECSPRAQAKLQSFGERLSSQLFAWALNKQIKKDGQALLVDARKAVKTDSSYPKATVDFKATQKSAQSLCPFNLSTVYVTQGFIGADKDGHTTLLGRGGSDYSAAIFAEALGAEVLQIWTDVSGIKTTDPKICPLAKHIKEIGFQEASELAIFGAKILHPATLIPAQRKGIKTYVGNSFAPNKKGTWILKKKISSSPLVRAMAKRDDQCLITLSTPKMLYAHGFLYHIFKVFNNFSISVDSVTTSEVSVAITVDRDTISSELLKSLRKLARVNIEEKLTLISLIGNNINYIPGLAADIFHSLRDVNVRMICQGASKNNFCFLVSSDSGEQVLKKLHRKFIEEMP